MRNALTHFVVYSHERAFGLHTALYCPARPLNNLKQPGEQIDRNVGKRIIMLPRRHKAVARKQWTVIEKHDDLIVLVHDRCFCLPSRYLAEHTIRVIHLEVTASLGMVDISS